MPGPSVVVCKGDTLVVEVINKLQTEITSVHFHGRTFYFGFTERKLKNFSVAQILREINFGKFLSINYQQLQF